MADIVTALSSELRQGETDEKMYRFADDAGSDYWLVTGVNKKFKERTNNINNNNIWGKSENAFKTTQGSLSSSLRESNWHCRDLADVKFLTLSTEIPHPMQPENDVTTQGLRLGNCHLDTNLTNDINSVKFNTEEAVKSLPAKTVCKRNYQAAEGMGIEPEKVKGVIELTADDENEPLTVKERIRNIDLSMEWIKSELSLMRAQSLSLIEQYEELFAKIIDLKLRMEMEKDEGEPHPEEETSYIETHF